MAEKIVMPSLGMYTSESTLVNWNQPSGAPVEMGQAVAEIETEKAIHEVPAPASGRLHHVASVGTLLKEEGLLGYILAEGEQPPGESADAVNAPQADAGAIPPAVRKTAASTATPSSASADSATIKASPIARRLATRHGLDIARIEGTGPGGRIVESDVLAAAETANATGTAAPSPAPLAQNAVSPRVRQRAPLSPTRRTIAERLRHSMNIAASLTLTREVEADRLVAARRTLSDRLGAPISYDALFVKFLAAGLREHLELNSMIEDGSLVTFDDVNIAVAVSSSHDLAAPVIRNADSTPLSSVAASIRELTERARSNALRPDDLTGGTATITNLGSYGVDAFTPILNPPQSSILGIGRIQQRAVVRGDTLAPAWTCVLSLTFDHRVTDGVPAARLLDTIARSMNDETYLAGLA